jgi:hypothetical protein
MVAVQTNENEWNELDTYPNDEQTLRNHLGGEVRYDASNGCIVWQPAAPHEWLIVELYRTATADAEAYNDYERRIVDAWRELAQWNGDGENAANGCTILKRCDGGLSVLVNAPMHGGYWKSLPNTMQGQLPNGIVAFSIQAFAAVTEPVKVGAFILKPPAAFGERGDIADNLAAYLFPHSNNSVCGRRSFLHDPTSSNNLAESLAVQLEDRYRTEGDLVADLIPPELFARALGIAQFGYAQIEVLTERVSPPIRKRVLDAWNNSAWRKRLDRVRNFLPPLPGALFGLYQTIEVKGAAVERDRTQTTYDATNATELLNPSSVVPTDVPAVVPAVAQPLEAVELHSEADLFRAVANELRQDFVYLPTEQCWANFRVVNPASSSGIWQVGDNARAELLRATLTALDKLQHIAHKRTMAFVARAMNLLTLQLAAPSNFTFDSNPNTIGIGTQTEPLCHDLVANVSRPMMRTDFISKLTNVHPATNDPLDPAYDHDGWKRWNNFLLSIHSNGESGYGEAQVAMVGAAFGAAAFGVTGDQVPILQGTGGNGKGVLMDVAAVAFGDYAGTLDHRALFDPKAHPSGLHGLRGLRFVSVNEPEALGREPWSMAQLKAFTGGNLITTRAMHTDAGRHYVPTATLFVNTNDVPDVLNPGNAERRRLVRIVYPNNYPESVAFKRSIIELAPIVLRWTLDRAAEVAQRRANNQPTIVIPESMRASTSDWLGDTNDTFSVVRTVLVKGSIDSDFIGCGELTRVVNRVTNNLNGIDEGEPSRLRATRKAISRAISKLFNEGRDFKYCRQRVGDSQPHGWSGLRFANGYSPHELDSTFGTTQPPGYPV